MSIKDLAGHAVSSPKAGATVAAVTTSSGLGTALDWIPSDIGKLATLVGIALSAVLIYTHLRRGKIEYEKARLEVELLRKKSALFDLERAREEAGFCDKHEDK